MTLNNNKYRKNIKFCQLIIKGPKLLTKNHNKMSVVTLKWMNFHIPFIHSFIYSYSVDPHKVTEPYRTDIEIVNRQCNKSHTYT
jgi:hypothetical protein